MLPIADIVDVEALLSVVAASFLAGIGLTIGFSVVILTLTHAAERRRDGRLLGSVGFGAIASLAGLGCLALVGFGISTMVTS